MGGSGRPHVSGRRLITGPSMLPIKPSNLRRRVQRALCVAIGAWLLTAPAWAEDAPAMRRGIGIADALGWAPVEPAPSRAFVYPPFDESTESLGNELKALRRT